MGKEEPKAGKLPKRSEIPLEDTWALEDMYEKESLWEEDLERIRVLAGEIGDRQGRLGTGAEALVAVMERMEELELRLGLAYGYAARKSDVDVTNGDNQALVQRVRSLSVETASRIAFLEPEIIGLEESVLETYFREIPELERYRRWIGEVLRGKSHRLSAEMEELLAAAGEMQATPSTIFSMLNNADLKFPEIRDEKGELVEVTHGRFVPLEENGDRRVRKDAFEALYHTYGKFENTLAAAYNGQVKQLSFEARARKYGSTLEAALDVNNVPQEVYHNLIRTVNDNLDKMHRYVSLRKKCLGVEELHMYDVYVPMIQDVAVKIPFAQAKETVKKALAPLGERYGALLEEGFSHRWIDMRENVGKRSGAYSSGIYGTHPFVLLNYNETLDNQFTLAHEMGHALHSYLSNESQNVLDAGYRIFVAEVASTCNEVLLMEYLLGKTTDRAQRAYLINHYLDSFKGTLYRQTMFAEFELLTNQASERGESLTPQALKKWYYELNEKYYGPDMVSDPEIALEWARIPHFYYNFYVYQYATGFSAAVAIANRILTQGEPAVRDYLRFLSMGNTASPVELLKVAGVDMSRKEPIQEALDVFGRLLDEMEELIGS